MRQSIAWVVGLLWMSWVPAGWAADLTPTEERWLQGAWPVVSHARQEKLPLDIVVQPQPTPGASPLAMAFVGGRCKLVLSMRGNPQAEDMLRRIEPDLLDATLELMAAHELGHCRRSLDGAWQQVPSGFAPPQGEAQRQQSLEPALQAAYAQMRATRREEGFGDMVGLAWVAQRHPQRYARLHAWLTRERLAERVPGSHHDTLAWLRLAASPAALTAPGNGLFEPAAALWAQGLSQED